MIKRLRKQRALKKELQDTIYNIENDGLEADIKVSVYDIESRVGANVNGNYEGWAASIIKVPIMMATLQEIEGGNLSLESKLTIDHSLMLEPYDHVSTMPNGSEIEVYDLMRHMISASDNEATNLLGQNIGVERLNKYFKKFGMKRTMLGHLLCPGVERYSNKFNPDGSNLTCSNDMTRVLRKVYDDRDKTFSAYVKDQADHFMTKTSPSFLGYGPFDRRDIKAKIGIIHCPEDGADEHEVGIIDDSLVVSIMMNKINQKARKERDTEFIDDNFQSFDEAYYDKMQLRSDFFGDGSCVAPQPDTIPINERISPFEAYERIMTTIANAFPQYVHEHTENDFSRL